MSKINTEYNWIVENLKTPYRLSYPVLEPTGKRGDFDSDMVDGPFVFRHESKWCMTYVGYDGRGYRTGLAESNDLIQWKRLGLVLDWGEEGCSDSFGAACGWILREHDLSQPFLKRYRDKYWLFYNSYDRAGYEQGIGRINIAYGDGDLTDWEKADYNPILDVRDKDVGEWEKGTLYKSCCVEEGEKFYLFYNARDLSESPWKEETGLAESVDLKKWERYRKNPVIKVSREGWDSFVCGDPAIYRYGDFWVMFYYGFAKDFAKDHAQDGVAFSKDLIRWEKWQKPILTYGSPGGYDDLHAHKPCVVMNEGVIYHFYCGVRRSDGYRTICLATSQPVSF